MGATVRSLACCLITLADLGETIATWSISGQQQNDTFKFLLGFYMYVIKVRYLNGALFIFIYHNNMRIDYTYQFINVACWIKIQNVFKLTVLGLNNNKIDLSTCIKVGI